MLLQSVSVSYFYSVYSRSRFVRVGRSVCTFGVTRGRLVLLCFFAWCGFECASLGRRGVRRGRRPSDHCGPPSDPRQLSNRLGMRARTSYSSLIPLPQAFVQDKTFIETRSEKAMPQYSHTHTRLISLSVLFILMR